MKSSVELTRVPRTDPLEIYRYRDGLYAADLLTAALVGFDFFTWLDAHPSDKHTICEKLGMVERPADVMLTLFTANGFVRCLSGIFRVTELAREHLVGASQWCLSPYFASLADRPVAKDFVTVLRTGRPANWGSYQDEKEWSHAMLTPEFARTFTAAMDCRGFYLGPAMARKLDTRGCTSLLDIGGGSGIYACAIVAHHPRLNATVFERPPVDRIARTMIGERGFADRVSVIAGDMFAGPLPTGHDVHLFSNVLHDWDVDKVKALLVSSFAALNPGGLVVVHDAHLNARKTGPLPVAEYSALLMCITEGRCHSVAEMNELLEATGFRSFRFEKTVADRSIVTARKPAPALVRRATRKARSSA